MVTRVFCLINTEVSKEEEALKYLNSLEDTRAHLIYGVHDIIAEITKKNMKEFEEFYYSKIEGRDGIKKGIRSSTACIVP